MIHHRVPPPRPLRGLIDSFSYWEGGTPVAGRMTAVARPGMSLQVNLAGPTLRWYGGAGRDQRNVTRGISLAGVHSRPIGIDAYQARVLRVRFKPGGAFALFDAPPGAMRDTHVSLDDLWGA